MAQSLTTDKFIAACRAGDKTVARGTLTAPKALMSIIYVKQSIKINLQRHSGHYAVLEMASLPLNTRKSSYNTPVI